jgi:hypothetical protein
MAREGVALIVIYRQPSEGGLSERLAANSESAA